MGNSARKVNLMKRRNGNMKVYNQSAFIPDFPVCISSTSGNISLTLQDAKTLADQLREVINNIEKKQ